MPRTASHSDILQVLNEFQFADKATADGIATIIVSIRRPQTWGLVRIIPHWMGCDWISIFLKAGPCITEADRVFFFYVCVGHGTGGILLNQHSVFILLSLAMYF